MLLAAYWFRLLDRLAARRGKSHQSQAGQQHRSGFRLGHRGQLLHRGGVGHFVGDRQVMAAADAECFQAFRREVAIGHDHVDETGSHQIGTVENRHRRFQRALQVDGGIQADGSTET